MKVIAAKTFRPMHMRNTSVHAGETLNVSEVYGNELIRTGLAVEPKALPEHQNKMLAEFENKGMPTQSETPEERTTGYIGPDGKGKSNKARTIKDAYFDGAGEDPEPNRIEDNAAGNTNPGSIVTDMSKAGTGQDKPKATK